MSDRVPHLALVSSSFPRSVEDSTNAGVFVADLARKLRERDVPVVVLTPQQVTGSVVPGVPIRTISWPGDESSLTHLDPRNPLNVARFGALVMSGIAACIGEFRRRRVRHALALWGLPSGLLTWVASRVLGVPYSVWVLGSDVWRAGDYPFGRRILRRVLRDARQVYANGLDLAGRAERLSGRRCTFLAASRELPKPTADPPDLDAGRTHFLTVARFHENKGIDLLLRAVADLPEVERRRAQFHVFGGGPEESHLRRLAGHLAVGDVVDLNGYLSPRELVGWLRTADCLVMPSRIESLPVLLADAAQAGCPVIATDVGDVGRLVADYRAGWVVPPDAESIRGAIRGWMSGDRRFDAGRVKQLADFMGMDRTARQLLDDVGWAHPDD